MQPSDVSERRGGWRCVPQASHPHRWPTGWKRRKRRTGSARLGGWAWCPSRLPAELEASWPPGRSALAAAVCQRAAVCPKTRPRRREITSVIGWHFRPGWTRPRPTARRSWPATSGNRLNIRPWRACRCRPVQRVLPCRRWAIHGCDPEAGRAGTGQRLKFGRWLRTDRGWRPGVAPWKHARFKAFSRSAKSPVTRCRPGHSRGF